MHITIDIPESATLGDLITARGAIFDASATFVDWDRLYNGGDRDAISPPGRILLGIANELRKKERS